MPSEEKSTYIEVGNPGKREGWITIDIKGSPDIKHDLNIFPYPFHDSSVNYIEARHIIEHFDNPLKVIMELHRILRWHGILKVWVPYGNTTMLNPQHKHDFLPKWFESFEKSDSKYLNETIGGMFRVLDLNIVKGSIRFWKRYEILISLRKEGELNEI